MRTNVSVTTIIQMKCCTAEQFLYICRGTAVSTRAELVVGRGCERHQMELPGSELHPMQEFDIFILFSKCLWLGFLRKCHPDGSRLLHSKLPTPRLQIRWTARGLQTEFKIRFNLDAKMLCTAWASHF